MNIQVVHHQMDSLAFRILNGQRNGYLRELVRRPVWRGEFEVTDRPPLAGFLSHQSHGPPGATFRRVTAARGDAALPVAVLQRRGRAGPLLLVECPFESPLLVAMAALTNGLWS